ncbi:MAG TPA: hypothetical protein VGA88_02080 [Burkholderiales bacterium]
MAQTSSNSFTVQIVAPPPPLTASFQLTSATGGSEVPFTIGYAFRKGDVPNGTSLSLDAGTAQVIVKRRWNDNSAKHVVISGHAPLSAGVALAIEVVSGAGSATPALTSADIQAAAPGASVQCGSIGTVSLASLLGSPFRTWISGPEMVECHYRAQVGSDASLRVWFHVRLYRGGRVWVRAICENGFIDTSNANKSYVPTVTIGGAVVYNNGGSSLTHHAHTRWDLEGWIGGDPQVTPKHNVAQLIATRLVPNYWKRNPGASTLNGLYQTYAPMQRGGWTQDQSGPGFHNDIGLLPLWDALYCASGDARAYRSVIANARALNSYGIVWRDSADNLPTRPSGRPTWSVDGNHQGGSNGWSTGPLNWDMAHHGSGGYVAYLISGDYYFLETMQHQASLCYLCNDENDGVGTARIFAGQTRAMAWSLRTVGQLAAIGPAGDGVTGDYAALLANNMTYWDGQSQRSGQNLLGVLYSYELATGGYGPGVLSPWQQNFVTQTQGHLSDLEPLASMSALNSVRNYYDRWPVGMLGGNGVSNYCYTQAGNYTLKVANSQTGDTANYYDSWGTVYEQTIGSQNLSCGTSLQGSSGGDPAEASTGYWGNLMPAIAQAVDHGATDAAAAWARLTSASNWNVVANSGFDNVPIWGIVPRGFGGT